MTKKPWRWNNQTLVYLTVKNEKELREWYERLRQPASLLIEDGAVLWCEPDWNDQATAMAVLAEREVMMDLPLL